MPNSSLGRIGISLSAADSNRVHALIEAKEGGLYRSGDAGRSWTRASEDGALNDLGRKHNIPLLYLPEAKP